MIPSKDNTFCWFPFSQLALKEWDAGGIVNATPCCNMIRPETPDPMGLKTKLKNTSPTAREIFHGAEMSELRSSMLKGVRHSACDVCWRMEDRGSKSYRLTSSIPGEAQRLRDPQLQVIDFSFGENCNLRCRICAPGLSNKLRIDYRYFLENDIDTAGMKDFDHRLDHPVTQQENGGEGSEYVVKHFSQAHSQWQDILDNIHELRSIKATGGETTLTKGFLEFIDTAIQRDCAKDIVLEFHSNCTKFTDKLMNKLNQFKELRLNASIDSYGDNYHYMRYPWTWDRLTHSIENYLNKNDKPGTVSFNPVVTALNVHHLVDLYNYHYELHTQYGRPELYWSFWVDLVWPENKYINIKFLPKRMKQDLIQQLSAIVPNDETRYFVNIENIIAFLQQHLEMTVTEQHRQNMLREVTAFDKSRNQSYTDYLHADIIEFLETPR